jgi:hypothetical protein
MEEEERRGAVSSPAVVGFSYETSRCMFQNYDDSLDEASENLLELLVKDFLGFVVGN